MPSFQSSGLMFCLDSSGYKYSYPFLDKSAGIIVKDNYVEPLYMHVVNTQHPTMAFIGVAYGGISFQMYDLQVNAFKLEKSVYKQN